MESPKKGSIVGGTTGAAECFRPYFLAEKNEKMLALLLDNAGGFIKVVELGTGVINSNDDLRLTHNIREMLRPVGIRLYDHMIYADGDWFCISEREDAARYLTRVDL